MGRCVMPILQNGITKSEIDRKLKMTTIFEPNYPKKILSFPYCGFEIQICIDEEDNWVTYSAWVGYDYGWAMAIPVAKTRRQAIQAAKKWVDLKRSSHG